MILDNNIVLVWIAATVAFFVPVLYLMWYHKIHQAWGFMALLLFAFAIYWAAEMLLSYPKPMKLELFPVTYHVLHFQVVGGKAVYLYVVDAEKGGTPRSYSLAWSPEVSKLVNKLIIGRAETDRDGGRLLYNPSLRSEGVKADYPPPLRTTK